MAVSSAPLWLRNATFPGKAMSWAKVAFRPASGFMMPRQLGPITRIFWPPKLFSDLLFESCAFGAAFLETGGDDNRCAHARVDAFADNLRDRRSGCDDYR